MNIVIVGAGEVGHNIASTLASEGHNINLVEQNAEKAEKAAAELDVRVICGNGSRPQVLYDAGVREGCNIDLLVACTVHNISCSVLSIRCPLRIRRYHARHVI